MKKITTLLLLVLVLIVMISCKIEDKEPIEKVPATTNKKLVFPEDFLGRYQGVLKNTTSNGVEDIPMEFAMLRTADSTKYDYQIKYGSEEKARSYTLIRTFNPNIYELDENNGIVLPIAYADLTLFSTFEVAGNLLHNSIVFHEDRMDFIITMSALENKEESGEAAGYAVSAYPISVMQQATLFKVMDSLDMN